MGFSDIDYRECGTKNAQAAKEHLLIEPSSVCEKISVLENSLLKRIAVGKHVPIGCRTTRRASGVVGNGLREVRAQLSAREIAINAADGKQRGKTDGSQVHDAARVEAAGGLRGAAKGPHRTKRTEGHRGRTGTARITAQIVAEDDSAASPMRAEIPRGRG